MLEEGIIEPSNSPWSAPIVLVRKKDGSFRYCIDYRLLNKVTVGDAYPIPRVSFDVLQGSRWFSTLDLMSGYWQVEMDPADKQKTAFVCQEGLFHFNLMPFGLTNAPLTFERLMETVLAGLQYNICLVYLDDIIVYGADFDEEISRLKQVFSRLIKAGLKLKPKTCVLFQQKVAYLGHIVSHTGVAPDPSKIEAVENWPTPSTVTEVRSFLGLAAYYRRFVKDFATIASPLHKLTEKGKKFHWNEDCQTSFEALQRCLVTAPILAYPKIEEPFILDTDASNVGIGAVLSQKLEGKEHAIAYGSRCLSKPERRYCVTRRELLAIVYFVKYFRHYLYGRQFLLRTDHGSLRWLFNFKEPEGQVARWIETLSTFTFEIEHRPGKQHGNADDLSRRPCKQCGQEDVVPVHLVLSEDVAEMPTRTIQTSLETESWIDGWCHETLRANQQEDPDIGKILKMKEESPHKPQWKAVSSENEAVKAYWFLWTQLYIKNGVLYKLWEEETSPTGHWQLVLPIMMREQVMEMLHNHKSAGHLGQHKTLARVRMRFYWYKLKDDVKNWCNQCEVCAKKKMPIPKGKAKLQQHIVGCPLERVALDILGPLPRSSRGNRYILVVADYFTRWTEAYPIPNQEATTVARRFIVEFVCRYGAPLQILTDQGAQFQSQLFAEMCQLLNIDKIRTSSYHPQTDGLVERFNRTLTSMLSHFVNDHQRDWDDHVPMVMMAYRSTSQETTNISPNRMMMGCEIRLPVDLLVGNPPEESYSMFETDYIQVLQERLHLGHEWARVHLKRGAERQKKLYDIRATSHGYRRGQFVWLYTPVKKKGLCSKLQKFWDGPYLIVNKLSDALYHIQKSRRSSCKIVHYNRLKLFNGKQRMPWLSGNDPALVIEERSSPDENRNDRTLIECPVTDSETDESDDENRETVEAVVEEREVLPERSQSSLPDRSNSSVGIEDRSACTDTDQENGLRRSKRNIQPPRRLIEEI